MSHVIIFKPYFVNSKAYTQMAKNVSHGIDETASQELTEMASWRNVKISVEKKKKKQGSG